jgi:hypothetical protein
MPITKLDEKFSELSELRYEEEMERESEEIDFDYRDYYD